MASPTSKTHSNLQIRWPFGCLANSHNTTDVITKSNMDLANNTIHHWLWSQLQLSSNDNFHHHMTCVIKNVIKWMSSSKMTFGMLYCQYYHPSIIGVSSPPPTFWLNDDNLQINPFALIPNLSRPTVVKITFETKQSIKPTTYWVMIKAVSISNWEAPGGRGTQVQQNRYLSIDSTGCI